MTAEEFRTRWTGHVPKVQDVTGEYAVLVPLVERPEGLCLLYEVRADTLGRQRVVDCPTAQVPRGPLPVLSARGK